MEAGLLPEVDTPVAGRLVLQQHLQDTLWQSQPGRMVGRMYWQRKHASIQLVCSLYLPGSRESAPGPAAHQIMLSLGVGVGLSFGRAFRRHDLTGSILGS